MNQRPRAGTCTAAPLPQSSRFRIAPLAHAVALALVSGSVYAAPGAFGPAWFAAMGAAQSNIRSSGLTVNGNVAGIPTTLQQQQQAQQTLQQSVNNLNRTAAAIAAAQAAQNAARLAASNAASSIPDGLAAGGLQVDDDPLTRGWINAQAPTQSVSGGHTTVDVQQTADKAILNWQTFNVGRNTTLQFDQNADWSVLNRVNDPQAQPSKILGQIKAPGTVMIINRNGIIFCGSSQVNVRNLAAAAVGMSDAQFNKGLYSDSVTQAGLLRYTPSFGNDLTGVGATAQAGDATGDVSVEAGAQISTTTPQSVTDGGGYVMLLGRQTRNAGTITTPDGQTVLAAGDSFVIRKGLSTDGNTTSTTRGNEVASRLNAGSLSGTVENDGVIAAQTGDITLTGHAVIQNGIVLATTSVDTRGTIHLLNSASDTDGSIVFSPGSVTSILLPDTDQTALDAQRDALIANDPAGNIQFNNDGATVPGLDFDNLGRMADLADESRVEVVTGGTVDFQSDSMTLATGGQVAVSAGQRSLVENGANIDVAGAVGVKVAMESNSLEISVQGNEQRDSPGNRDSGALNSTNVWVDRRTLVFVPAGTDGYPTDRWYTAGGLLEVSGYLATDGHSVGEWMAQGGTVTFTGKEVVTQSDSKINLSGGTLDVQAGVIKESWLWGTDGKLYEVSSAPGDLQYTGVYQGYEDSHPRWGDTATRFFYNPLIAPRQRSEDGYTVGRDAGKLVISTDSAIVDGSVEGDVYQGPRQTQPRQDGLDGYYQTQTAAAGGAQLVVGGYQPLYDKDAGAVTYNLSATIKDVVFGTDEAPVSDQVGLDQPLPADRQSTLYLDSNQLNQDGWGAITIAASDTITVNGALSVQDGGAISLYGPDEQINAGLTARGGSITLGNVFRIFNASSGYLNDVLPAPPGSTPQVSVANGATLDTHGRSTNLLLDPVDGSGLPYMDGGAVSIHTTGGIDLAQGSAIDVSSGAVLLSDGQAQGGKGGDVTLIANDASLSTAGGAPGALVLDGELRATGMNGGGTLTLATQQVLITNGDTGAAPVPGQIVLGGDFFQAGFSNYDVTGYQGLSVADGTVVDVFMPVYRYADGAAQLPTGDEAAGALERWTPPLYEEDPVKDQLTQRAGASLALSAGVSGAPPGSQVLDIGSGAVLTVDPGQSITLQSAAQLTVDGRLNAWSGSIVLQEPKASFPNGTANSRSIWIGSDAVLDVAARPATAVDAQGQAYGFVPDGGSIVVGGVIDPDTGTATAADEFVVVRPGAVLDASGAQAVLDINHTGTRTVASNGGSIAFASNDGLFLDGSLHAAAGGAGAAGGTLSLALETPVYDTANGPVDDAVRQPRELIVGQGVDLQGLSADAEAGLGSDALVYGHGYLDTNAVAAGGFDNLSLLSNGILDFDGNVSLRLAQSVRIYAGALALADASAADALVRLQAPYVLLAGETAIGATGGTGAIRPTVQGGVSQQSSEARFEVDADLLDIRDNVNFGANGTIALNNNGLLSVDRRGFDTVALTSNGDIRLLAGNAAISGAFTTRLATAGDMVLTAAQIYPATGASAEIFAGFIGGPDYAPGRTLTIGMSGDVVPPVPYSAFGTLQLGAETIDQGGVLRAPLGSLEVGTNISGTGLTKAVNFLPGSDTSVSGAGLVMPYGGTVDGITYQYDGKTVVFTGVGGADLRGALTAGINLSSQTVDVQAGALLDLSGGGDLTGAGFISGRGGSTDARFAPLVQYDDANQRFSLPGLSTNPIYAIVPGSQAVYAPVDPEKGAVDPAIGQHITIGSGVPGLPAGTYTLLPSTYALLPGAFRVEIEGAGGPGVGIGASTFAMRNGSWSTTGTTGIANTGISASLPSRVIVTSADVLRTYSQYDETSYTDFALADAVRQGVPRPMLPADAKTLELNLQVSHDEAPAFTFEGTGNFTAADGGYGGTAAVPSNVEVLATGATPTAGFNGISLYAQDLDNIGATRLVLGSVPYVVYGQSGNLVNLAGLNSAANVVLRQGAVLSAPEVFLVSGSPSGGILIEEGAGINTLGQGAAPYDSNAGFVYAPGTNAVVAVSNGWLDMLPPAAATANKGAGAIDIGACVTLACAGTTTLYSEGTIAAATDNGFSLGDAVRFGTRNLVLAVGSVNAGSAQTLAALDAQHALPPGLTMNQDILDRLLDGDSATGAPALQSLVLTARDSINLYGSVSLDTIDPSTGKSTLDDLVLTSPAIYGYGGPQDQAVIRTGTLVWNGATGFPGAVIANGAGTGSGVLSIDAQRIEFGYGPDSQPSSVDSFDRLVLGFSTVNLAASDRITSNHSGTLTVYQSQGAYVDGSGYTYSGGNLNIQAPVLTGEAGSVNHIKAGGAITVTAPAGADPAATSTALGAELSLDADSITVDAPIVLPSGKLTLTAQHDVVLDDGARVDMSGRTIPFNDLAQYSWGGDLILQSQSGNITQTAGSRIDLSAVNNQAGTLTAIALADAAGVVDLQGSISGAASGYYDAGGTMVPYAYGGVDIRGQQIADFAGLNQRLNDGQVVGSRSFDLKQGSLIIDNEVKANQITISVDNGSLTVAGTIDASGEQVGSIRLSANDGLTLQGSAVLDAHGTVLRVDSSGNIIDAPNRATVDLNSGNGRLTLESGAAIDLRAGTGAPVGGGPGSNDGVNRGTVELDAPRLGGATGNDIDIDASGPLAIQGAASIAVNGFWRYTDAPDGTDPSASGRPYQIISQSYLDQKNADSVAFMNNALANSDLMQTRLGGLRAYGDAFHLRPGVEIDSKTPDGDLVVQGDLDMSGYRYPGVNPNAQQTGVYGSGEPGTLIIRAGGDLDIYGSINDGFAPPPETPDDNGWVLVSQVQPYGSDVIVPAAGVILADGTTFPAGATLNYNLPIKAMTFAAGTRLPVAATLTAPLVLTAGTVVTADIRDASGQIIHAAGTVLGGDVTLPSGTQLGAGTVLAANTALDAVTWPKGVPLPHTGGSAGSPDAVVENGSVALPVGAFIPSQTDVQLDGGASSINLRTQVGDQQGRNWAVAQMLPQGSLSWSVRLVAGADLGAADSRLVKPDSHDGALNLADTHYAASMSTLWLWSPDNDFGATPGTPVDSDFLFFCGPDGALAYECSDGGSQVSPFGQDFSVIRTGTGDLDLLAAGNISMSSPYGVYTAGTQSAALQGDMPEDPYNQPRGQLGGSVLGVDGAAYEGLVNGGPGSLYQAWYPENGGNVLLAAGGDLTGDSLGAISTNGAAQQQPSEAVGDWLWRQGTGTGSGADAIPTAWWINFGTYALPPFSTPRGSDPAEPYLVGFTGIGALGGGNVSVNVGGNAGMITPRGDTGGAASARSQGLVIAIGSTGRMAADGSMVLTGGGDLNMRVGGGINTSAQARMEVGGQNEQQLDLNGELVDLRGAVRVSAGAIGLIDQVYGSDPAHQDPSESRAYDAFTSTMASSTGGLVLVPGDATVSISTRGDLVVGGAADPGRVPVLGTTPFSVDGTDYAGGGFSWFSLWTGKTAIDLLSAGGNLTPSTQLGQTTAPTSSTLVGGLDASQTDGSFIYPSILKAVAASGNLYLGPSALFNAANTSNYSLLLAPSPTGNGQLDLLAAGSIYAGGYTVTQSGADPVSMPTPLHPAFVGMTFDDLTRAQASNLSPDGINPSIGSGSDENNTRFSLFTFGPETASGVAQTSQPARFYALDGDIVGLQTGKIIVFSADSRPGQTWYDGAGPVWMEAGRDIVNSGTELGTSVNVPSELSNMQGSSSAAGTATGNLIVQNNPDDISIVSAGRDIRYSNFNVAGPGQLEVIAGRNLLEEDKASINSIGPVNDNNPGDHNSGASIAVIVGAGAQGPDYTDFAARYLDSANQAISGMPLADQSGKVVKTYQDDLVLWLHDRYGYSGSADDALAYFDALPAEQQQVFDRQVYFEELLASGREFNDPASPRADSYLRGRDAIAALFPGTNAAGAPIAYSGDLTMFGDAGIETLFGGNIQVLTPGGQQVYGTEGVPPAGTKGTPGVITQGSGDIQMYSLDSILLGQSRIMTTFGGNIQAWSAQGDINAGKGSKTTVVYTPPLRVYDSVGDVSLSSSVPSTGAGIATLDPIPEVPAGDVDLTAPLGTIDAGEAGIRVSGNVNLAALHIVNAANIQVQGKSTGIPVVAAVNSAALTSASSAATAAANAAESVTRQQQAAARQALPSIITVQVLGFGNESISPAPGAQEPATPAAVRGQPVSYDPNSAIQLVGNGQLSTAQQSQLTDTERYNATH